MRASRARGPVARGGARDWETAGDAGWPSALREPGQHLLHQGAGALSLEYMVATYPGLVEGPATPGIGFVLVYSEARGHVVMGQGLPRPGQRDRGRG